MLFDAARVTSAGVKVWYLDDVCMGDPITWTETESRSCVASVMLLTVDLSSLCLSCRADADEVAVAAWHLVRLLTFHYISISLGNFLTSKVIPLQSGVQGYDTAFVKSHSHHQWLSHFRLQ